MRFPFPAIASALRERRAVHPRVPDVTEADVERIARRDFPAAQLEDAKSILAGFTGQWEWGTHRIQLAALKLADGNLDLLRCHIDAAKRDYRDVLVAAEYPNYWKAAAGGLNIRNRSKAHRQQIVDADWQQYEGWLRRL